jgi:NADPH2:quinone reductase
MRAIVIREGGGPEVLKVEDVAHPEPDEGQVLVRVEAAAVNHFDLTQRQDPAATGASPPFTPGVEAAGTRLDTGERVLVTGALGAYAELLAAPSENVWPIPDSLETAKAAALGVAYKTAWASLTAGDLRRGDAARPGLLKRHGTRRDRHRSPPRSDGLRHRERGEARPLARAGRRTARL